MCPVHCHIQQILKASEQVELTRLDCRYTALLAHFQVMIKDVFGEAHKYFAMPTNELNIRLGLQ